MHDLAGYRQNIFILYVHSLGVSLRSKVRVYGHLCQTVSISKVDKQKFSVVSSFVDPTVKCDDLANVFCA